MPLHSRNFLRLVWNGLLIMTDVIEFVHTSQRHIKQDKFLILFSRKMNSSNYRIDCQGSETNLSAVHSPNIERLCRVIIVQAYENDYLFLKPFQAFKLKRNGFPQSVQKESAYRYLLSCITLQYNFWWLGEQQWSGFLRSVKVVRVFTQNLSTRHAILSSLTETLVLCGAPRWVVADKRWRVHVESENYAIQDTSDTTDVHYIVWTIAEKNTLMDFSSAPSKFFFFPNVLILNIAENKLHVLILVHSNPLSMNRFSHWTTT